jgi:1,4-alpha-glucan branching enzyme
MWAKPPGDEWQRAATLRALYGYMYAHPGKKLMFMGAEIGQHREWHHDRSLDWHLLERPLHKGLQQFVKDLNRTYASEPALHECDFESSGFQWIDCNDSDNSVVALMRRATDQTDFVIAVVNFTPLPRHGYVIGVPRAGRYGELLNSDSEIYGGSNVGNTGVVFTDPVPAHSHGQSLRLSLPPLGFLLLKPEKLVEGDDHQITKSPDHQINPGSSLESSPIPRPAPTSPTAGESASEGTTRTGDPL